MWIEIIFFIGAILGFLLVYKVVVNNRELFSSNNIQKSIFVFGIIALLLILWIAFCVVILKAK